MRPVDALAFLGTAAGVIFEDAVRAILIGCSLHILRYIYLSWTKKVAPVPTTENEPAKDLVLREGTEP